MKNHRLEECTHWLKTGTVNAVLSPSFFIFEFEFEELLWLFQMKAPEIPIPAKAMNPKSTRVLFFGSFIDEGEEEALVVEVEVKDLVKEFELWFESGDDFNNSKEVDLEGTLDVNVVVKKRSCLDGIAL